MLRAFLDVRQIAGEMLRRCFSDPNEDITVWVDAGGKIKGLELSNDQGNAERAVRWIRGGFDFKRWTTVNKAHGTIMKYDDPPARRGIP
jgi:hypothetical protein